MIERVECKDCRGHGVRWAGALWRLLGRIATTCETCKGKGVVYRRHRAF